MKNPPPGKEWMGLTKSQMMQGAKAYKFKKSAGASASAKRFGMDERAPKGRSPFPTSSFERRKRGR